MKLSAVLAAKGNRVFTIDPGSSIRDAIDTLAGNNIGALVVLGRAGEPVGLLSERDIIRAMASSPGAIQQTVADLMTSPVLTAAPDDDADSVLRTMTSGRFRHMPVVEGDSLVGMVTIGDLVKAQLTEFRGTVESLETRLLES